MVLQMFIEGKLVDAVLLSDRMMKDYEQRADYVQGAVHELLEKWADLLEDQKLQPEFYIKN